jgi:hypothetical protein
MSRLVTVDGEYKEWLINLKQRIKQSQIKASVRANSAMLELYWSIGSDIVEQQVDFVKNILSHIFHVTITTVFNIVDENLWRSQTIGTVSFGRVRQGHISAQSSRR